MTDRRKSDAYPVSEISLLHLWRALVKQKRLILLVWVIIFVAGVAAAAWLPNKYAYTTLMEIGRLVDEMGKDILVETADEARTRLVASIIPVQERKFLAEGKEVYALNVKVPDKSPSHVLLQSQGHALTAPSHLAFHGEVAEALRQEHQVLFINKVRERLTTEQQTFNRKIAGLQNERSLLTLRLKRLDTEEAYIKKQIEQIGGAIESKFSSDEKASVAKNEENATLWRVILTNQIEHLQHLLTNFEDRIVLQRDTIRRAIADNARAYEENRQTISIIATRLENLRETRVLLPPAQSANPVAPNRKFIIALSVFSGLMIGILVAFFKELIQKPRNDAVTESD